MYGGVLDSAGWATELKTVDLNGDGLRDVVVTQNFWGSDQLVPVNILLNRGGGRFVLATNSIFKGPPTATQLARKIVVADFNGDGKPDLFFADHGPSTELPDDPRHGHQNELALSTPSGKLVDATANLPQHSDFTHSAAAADIDGNGTVDLYLGNFSCCGDKTPAEILLNDGSGHFREAPDRLPSGNLPYTASEFVDVNGDGAPDLVLGGMEHWPHSIVLLNDGHGFFRSSEELPPPVYGSGYGIVLDIAPVDVNGDGHVDVLLAESQVDPYYIGSRIQVLINDGSGHFRDETATRMPQEPSAQSWPDRILVEDFNGDGKPDFAIQYAPPGKVAVPDPTPFYLNHDGVFEPFAGPREGASPDERGPVGLVNGAGPDALISVATREGSIASYYLSPQLVALSAPTGVATTSLRTGVRITWQAVAGATGYEVRRSGARLIKTTRTAVVDTRAQRGRSYHYAVRALDYTERGPLSAVVAGRRR